MKKHDSIIKKILFAVAEATSETTSCIGFYEPELPKQLVKKEKEAGE